LAVLKRGAPFEVSGTTVGSRLSTCLTSGSRAISAVNEAPALPEPLLYTVMVRSDGLVLARKAGYEDCVRLAAAIDAMAIPPISPIRSTTAR
jgi:hypothetical protein